MGGGGASTAWSLSVFKHALTWPLLEEVQCEQEVRVPPGLLVTWGPVAPPRRQSGVQEERRSFGAGRPQLCLVLQLMGQRERAGGTSTSHKQEAPPTNRKPLP